MTNIIHQVVESLEREVIEELRLTTAISHPGESGRAREEVIRRFLRRLVPRQYEVDTGFVIDGTGGISRQIDIVVYRTDYHPVVEVAGVKHFLAESVAIVIENKAKIGSAAVLADAVGNIGSVKALDKLNGGSNVIFPPMDGYNFALQTFGVVVAGSSLSPAVVYKHLLNFARTQPRHLWPNLYIDARDFHLTYLAFGDNAEWVTTCDTTQAEAISLERRSPSHPGPLVVLAQEMVNFLRIFPLIDFLPSSYFYKTSGDILWERI